MINSLKNFFTKPSDEEDNNIEDLYLLCGLMVEAANVDGFVDEKEVSKISTTLIEIFKEDSSKVKQELDKCLAELNENKSLHFFTSKINKSFSEEKKITLIEVLWQIILEDGMVHDYESNLIRRLAGLLYISDYECGKARKKALNNFKINEK